MAHIHDWTEDDGVMPLDHPSHPLRAPVNESLDALREADVPTLRRLITAMVFHHEFPYPYEDVMDALLARVRAEVAAEGRTASEEE